jgi:hypothetical protein
VPGEGRVELERLLIEALLLGLVPRSGRRRPAPRLLEDKVPSRRVEPRESIVGRDVREPPPRDGHRLGRDPVGIPAPPPPRVGRDGSEMGEHLAEARLGGLAIGLDGHAEYCRNAARALQAGPHPS